MINVTKTFLPPFDEYTAILKRAWDKQWITNNGELVQELEQKLKHYLNVENLLFTNNGTVVLQMALKALNITKEVITTPFSYVATTNAIIWENCKPIFVDIDKHSFCIDVNKIEEAITDDTQAILATHVYGYPCDVIAIEKLAEKYNLKVIYDGAHAFGTEINGRSLLSYGDISTCSFHATKLFHTVEGGCIICNNDELQQKLFLFRSFGHIGDDYFSIGINGKNSEFHAAMGLCIFKYIDLIKQRRKEQWLYYKELLQGSSFRLLKESSTIEYNYSYFPIVFENEEELLKITATLKKKDIVPRRYFFPSLNTLNYTTYASCPISESISKAVLCLPLFHDLSKDDQKRITEIILEKQKVAIP